MQTQGIFSGVAGGSGGGSFGGKDETLGTNNRLYLDDGSNHYIVYDGGSIDIYDSGTKRVEIAGSLIDVSAALRPGLGSQSLGTASDPWANVFADVWAGVPISVPSTPSSGGKAYFFDNAGTEELRVIFSNGTVKTIATDV